MRCIYWILIRKKKIILQNVQAYSGAMSIIQAHANLSTENDGGNEKREANGCNLNEPYDF